jgi:uncharacterized membrane protein
MMGSYGSGMGSLGWLGMAVFWLLLLGLIVWLVMRTASRQHRPDAGGVGRRMASGEIDISEWQTHRAALQGTQDSRK